MKELQPHHSTSWSCISDSRASLGTQALWRSLHGYKWLVQRTPSWNQSSLFSRHDPTGLTPPPCGWGASHVLPVTCGGLVTKLCDPMDCRLPGFSIHGILQARILEWAAISFSWESSQPRNQTQVSCIAGRFFTNWVIREAPPPASWVNYKTIPSEFLLYSFGTSGILLKDSTDTSLSPTAWVNVPFIWENPLPKAWTPLLHQRSAFNCQDGFYSAQYTLAPVLKSKLNQSRIISIL